MAGDHWDRVQELIRQMYAAPAEEAQAVCRRLLRLTLANGLDATAWDVLEAVADLDALWAWKELPGLLEQYRLPSERDKLREACEAHAGTNRIDLD